MKNIREILTTSLLHIKADPLENRGDHLGILYRMAFYGRPGQISGAETLGNEQPSPRQLPKICEEFFKLLKK
jgi:hypothetical protein